MSASLFDAASPRNHVSLTMVWNGYVLRRLAGLALEFDVFDRLWSLLVWKSAARTHELCTFKVQVKVTMTVRSRLHLC